MTALILLSEWRKYEIELWKPIEGYEGYEISSLGRLRSYWQRHTKTLSTISHIVKGVPHRQGYVQAQLCRGSERRKFIFTHRLVAIAFLAKKGGYLEVNHLTAIKSDNRAGNLEWTTHRLNQKHAVRLGVCIPASTRGRSKNLNEDKVKEIRRRCAAGEKQCDMATLFGVKQSQISLIVNRKSWTHVT